MLTHLDDSSCLFQLMSSEAAKEWVTITYTRVPSTSKLANKLPNKVTTFQINHHSDDIKTHVFRNSDVRSFRMPFDLTQLDDDSSCLFQLMSGEAAKECVTIAYTRVQSTSKLLTNKLPKRISNQAS